MKTAAICCARNESDIIEPFVRHTLAYCTDLLVLDHGSTDATPEILQRLQAEGLRLHIVSDPTLASIQVDQINRLLQTAAHDLAADWIFCLDSDEFIAGHPDTSFLPPPDDENVDCLKLGWRTYYAAADDPPGVLNPVERITRRLIREPWPETPDGSIVAPKVIVRGAVVRGRTSRLIGGNHDFLVDSHQAPFQYRRDVWLAHFTLRTPEQYAIKLAAFRVQRFRYLSPHRGENLQYDGPYFRMRAGYSSFAENFHREPVCHFPPHDRTALVRDPLLYLGAPLRYTPPHVPVDPFVRDLLDFAERLARESPTTPGAGESTAAPVALSVDVDTHPVAAGRQACHAADAALGSLFVFPLHCPPGTTALHIDFNSQRGMIEISHLSLEYAGLPERVFTMDELRPMLSAVRNTVAVIGGGTCRFLVSQAIATVAFRGWALEGEAMPVALRMKVRYEGDPLKSGLLTPQNLEAFNTNSERARAMEKLLDERLALINALTRELESVRKARSGPAVYPIGSVIDFSERGNSSSFAIHGWSRAESWGSWSDGEKAIVKLRLENIPARSVTLVAQARPFLAAGRKQQRVEVFLDGEPLASWAMIRDGIRPYTARIPAGKIRNRECEITFQILNPVSPKSLALGDDIRLLGLGLVSLRLE